MFGLQASHVRARTPVFHIEKARIDACNDVARIDGVADIRDPREYALNLGGYARVVETQNGTGHLDDRRHLT